MSKTFAVPEQLRRKELQKGGYKITIARNCGSTRVEPFDNNLIVMFAGPSFNV